MYRLFTVAVVILWGSAMTALFVRDVWPAWSAQDAPPLKPESIAEIAERDHQYGIYRDNERLGTAWSTITGNAYNATIRGTLVIEAQSFLPAVRIESETQFDDTGGLDGFWLRVYGLPLTRIHIRGERRGIYFPCEIHAGPFHRQANLDMSATRLIGDSLRPFSYLPELEVGQSWRMQLLDPMSAVLGGKARFKSIVARVVGMETINFQNRQVNCFVVETSPEKVTAWVGPDGEILLQEVELPGIGRVQTRSEPYDRMLRIRKTRAVFGGNEADIP